MVIVALCVAADAALVNAVGCNVLRWADDDDGVVELSVMVCVVCAMCVAR